METAPSGISRRRAQDFLWYGPARWAGARARDLAAVYAFCRLADDATDETGEPARARARLSEVERDFEACLEGRLAGPLYADLARAIGVRGLPPREFRAILEGFRMDLATPEHETRKSLWRYCALVADAPARLALRIWGALDAENERLAHGVATGLAHVNFVRDLPADLDRGRHYLPREDRERFGVSREALLAKRADERVRAWLASECLEARTLLVRGIPLVDRVPRGLAWRVVALVRGGLATLGAIERADFDVFDARPRLSRAAKARVALLAWLFPRVPVRP